MDDIYKTIDDIYKNMNDIYKNMDDIYKNIEEYNPNKRRKTLIVFDDMISDMLSNRKVNPIVTEYLLEEEN